MQLSEKCSGQIRVCVKTVCPERSSVVWMWKGLASHCVSVGINLSLSETQFPGLQMGQVSSRLFRVVVRIWVGTGLIEAELVHGRSLGHGVGEGSREVGDGGLVASQPAHLALQPRA